MSTFHINMCISYMQTCNIKLSCDFDTENKKVAIATWPSQFFLHNRNYLCREMASTFR